MELLCAVWSLLFVSMTEGKPIWEKETSTENIPPPDWPMGKALAIFMIDDYCERDHLTMGNETLRLVVLGAIRKLTRKAMKSKSVNSVLL